ncbi:MAG: hypothetical protein ABI862_12310 [Ilumatobacteraceae bacterium]
MTVIDLASGERASRRARVLRVWWPVPVCVGASVVAQIVTFTSRYDVGGHAAGHLSGASIPFFAAALLALTFSATPSARHQVDLLLASGIWLATTVLVMIGNLRVVDDLIAAGYSHTPTSSVPDVADHGLANSSVWYAEVAALVLIAAWRRRGHIGTRASLAAVVTTVIVPPWMMPGAGMIVLAIVRLVHQSSPPPPK